MLEDRIQKYHISQDVNYKPIIHIELKNFNKNYEEFEILQDDRLTTKDIINIISNYTDIFKNQIIPELISIFRNIRT